MTRTADHDEILARYRRRADAFDAKIVATRPDQWSNPSPCAEWDARGVVGHLVDMHGAMLGPAGRELGPAPALADDPLGAFRAARADVEALLADPEIASSEVMTPTGPMSFAAQVDGVVSADLVLHGWDLARATEQDDALEEGFVDGMLPFAETMPPEMRVPEAFGPGIVVFGPAVDVAPDAPAQDRLMGLLGRDPGFSPGQDG